MLRQNAQMKEEGSDVEMRKAAFVLRLWHRFVPFLPQPVDAGKRADLHDRKGKFATRVLAKADVPEKEARRLQGLTDDQGEEEVRREHDAATKKATPKSMRSPARGARKTCRAAGLFHPRPPAEGARGASGGPHLAREGARWRLCVLPHRVETHAWRGLPCRVR